MAALVTIFYLAVMILVAGAATVFIKRHRIGRIPVPEATHIAAEVVLESFQCDDRGASLREMEFRKKSWRQEAGDGEDIDTHLSQSGPPANPGA